jgi:hypothetical protein
MAYEMQVKMVKNINGMVKEVWSSIKPTNGIPYREDTKTEAIEFLNAWYPNCIMDKEIRIKEVK